MNLSILPKVEKLIVDNSPTILTAVGAVGTVATAYLTHKATLKAASIVAEQAMRDVKNESPERTSTELFKLTWMLYVPPVACGAATVGAIVMANRISMGRAAALAAAYSLSQNHFDEYKEKVLEKFGVTKEQQARDEVAQDRVNRNENRIMLVDSTDVLCFDQYSERYFRGSMEKLKQAQNAINFRILSRGFAPLSEFYEEVGLKPTEWSDEVGWNNKKQLDLHFSSTLTSEGQPCIAFEYNIRPFRSYELACLD